MRFFIMILLFLVVGCGELSAVRSSTEFASLTSREEVRHLLKVNDGLYRSGHLVESDMLTLRKMGVKSILSLESYSSQEAAREKKWARNSGIDFLWQRMDGHDKPTVAQINEALAAIQETYPDPVLVHCFHGSDRTGIVVAAYRIVHDHWTVERAIEEMRRHGHMPDLYWWDDVLYQL